MSEYWERLAEAQRVRQLIEVDFARTLTELRRCRPTVRLPPLFSVFQPQGRGGAVRRALPQGSQGRG